jgi:hypothetical protein
MSEYTEKTTREVIESNTKAIKSERPKIALKYNPNLLDDEQRKAELEIGIILNGIKKHYADLVPFINGLKYRVQDITEKTHFCAVYLLLCQARVHLESLFLLAENGNSSTMMLTVRPIKEALALAKLFSFEFSNMNDEHLKKWFSGEVITHGDYRKEEKNFFKEMTPEQIDYIKRASVNLYRMESHIMHSAYTSVIENISPFTEDFDFEKYTRFRRTSYNLGYVKGAIEGANISLKFIYKFLLNDMDSYNQLEMILRKYES